MPGLLVATALEAAAPHAGHNAPFLLQHTHHFSYQFSCFLGGRYGPRGPAVARGLSLGARAASRAKDRGPTFNSTALPALPYFGRWSSSCIQERSLPGKPPTRETCRSKTARRRYIHRDRTS